MPSFGVLGIGGTVSLVLGSMMLTATCPACGSALRLIVPGRRSAFAA